MQLGYKNNTNFKIAFTGMMLALVMLFQFLEKFMPIGGLFMKMNLSLVFIIASVYVVGYRWAIGLLLLRLFIGPALSTGYTTFNMWGHVIEFTSGFVYMNMFILFHRYLFRKFDSKLNLVLSAIVTTILSSLILAFMNAVFMSPMYWWLLYPARVPTPTPSSSMATYTYVKNLAFLGIPNYWGGMMAAFGLGNLAKFSVISVLFIALWKVVKHYEINKPQVNKKDEKIIDEEIIKNEK